MKANKTGRKGTERGVSLCSTNGRMDGDGVQENCKVNKTLRDADCFRRVLNSLGTRERREKIKGINIFKNVCCPYKITK